MNNAPALTLRNVVLAAHIIWTAQKVTPTAKLVGGIVTSRPLSEIEAVMQSDEFALEMYRHNVPWGDRDALSERQLLALAEVSNPLSGRDLDQRLAAAGVTHIEWVEWRRNPIFDRYYAEMTNDMLTQYKPELRAALIKQGLRGNIRALEYIDTLTAPKDDSAQKLEDLQTMVVKIMEIIQEVVPEKERLAEIATRIQLLGAVKQVIDSPGSGFVSQAKQLYGEPI